MIATRGKSGLAGNVKEENYCEVYRKRIIYKSEKEWMKERPIQNIQNSQEHQQLDIFTYESVCFMLWWLLMLLFHYLWKEESSQALIPWRLKLLRSLSFFFPIFFFFFFPRTSPFARFSWFLIYVLVQIFVFVIGSIWVLSKMVYLCFNSWILEDSSCGFGASIVCVF